MRAILPPSVRVLAVALSLAAFTTTGCSDPHKPVKVAGTVTVDGTPLDHGAIHFLLPNGKATAAGAGIQNGMFSVSVPPGSYKVTITGTRPVAGKTIKSEMGEEPVVEAVVPPKYGIDSQLTAEVTADGADLKFALEGIKPKPAPKPKR